MAERKNGLPLFPEAASAESQGSVECLGMTFESDEARRRHFLARLKEKLPELRQRHDFPHGEDEDILRLSDPPWYTACPNPFLAEFVEHHGRPYDPEEPYHREPFAVDVSAGKTDMLYRAHGYHTNVPHRAIVPSTLHYTKPGDVVLDGFCGSGMTGVAAQWCGSAPSTYRLELEPQWRNEGREASEWGPRRVILGDLSPALRTHLARARRPAVRARGCPRLRGRPVPGRTTQAGASREGHLAVGDLGRRRSPHGRDGRRTAPHGSSHRGRTQGATGPR